MRLPVRSWTNTLNRLGMKQGKARKSATRRVVMESLEDRRLFWADAITSGDPTNCSCDCGCGGGASTTTGNNLTAQPQTNSVAPTYNSGVNPHPIVGFDGILLEATPHAFPGAPTMLEAQAEIGGVDSAAVYFAIPDFDASFSYSITIELQVDASSLATGRYAWDINFTGSNANYSSSSTFDGGYITVINRIASPFGRGWWLNDLDQLVIQSNEDDDLNGVDLIRGNNTSVWFQQDDEGNFTNENITDRMQSPDPTFSTLAKNTDGTYTLTAKDGSIENFNSTGLLTARIDPNGNQTTYKYGDGGDVPVGDIASITDDVGRVTKFNYTEGMVSSVTDFCAWDGTDIEETSGSQTAYYDYTGDHLTTVTAPDPDGSGTGHPLTSPVTEYGYDSSTGLMNSVIDPNGNETDITYDIGRKVSTMSHPDGGTHHVGTWITASMVDLSSIGYDAAHPAALPAEVVSDPASDYQTDPDSNTTEYLHNDMGQVVEVIDATGYVTTYNYNSAGLVNYESAPDPDGAGPLGDLSTSYTIDSMGNVTEIDYPIGSEHWTYDSTFNEPTSHTDVDSNVTKYDIDPANGNVLDVRQIVGEDDTTTTDPDDPPDVVTTYTYTTTSDHASDNSSLGVPLGLLKTVTDPNGNVTEYTYNSHGLVHSIIQAKDTADQITTTYTYDPRDNLASVTDPMGIVTDYTYDNLDRLTSKTGADPDGPWGPLGRPVWQYQYDANGNVTYVTDPNGNTTQYTYTDHNRVEEIIQPDPDGTYGPLSSPVTQYDYDEANNLLSVTDPMGHVTTYTYDTLNRLSTETDPDPDGPSGPLTSSVTTYGYNSLGLQTSVTDPLGNVTNYTYDAMGRLLTETDPDPDGPSEPLTSPVTTYTYDDAGNRLSMEDSDGNTTSWTYDALNRVSAEIVSGDTTNERQYQYDANSNLIQYTDHDGRVTQYDYDHLNRETAERWRNEDNTDDVNTIGYSYDDDGNLLSAEDDSQNVASGYFYDNLGRVIQSRNYAGSIWSPGGGEAIEQLTYDNNSQVTDLNVTLGDFYDDDLAYTYDTLGRMTSVTQSQLESTISNLEVSEKATFSYNAAGQFTEIDRYSGTFTSLDTSPTLISTYGYDDAGRLTSLTHSNPNTETTIADYSFGYDSANRLTSVSNSIQSSEDVSYTYDNLNQLIEADWGDTDNNEQYSYDPNGNRQTSQIGATTTSYTIGSGNQLTFDGTYFYYYDNEGNLTSKVQAVDDEPDGPATYYTYDNRNRLTSVTEMTSPTGTVTQTSLEFYDVFDHWTGEKVYDGDTDTGTLTSERYFVYDDKGRLIEELDNAGNTGEGQSTHRYLNGPGVDMVLADEVTSWDDAETPTVGTLWLLGDAQNTVRDITDASGAVVNHRVFDSFGNMLSQTDSDYATEIGYTGIQFDANIGLQNNWHRWYIAGQGRWMGEDPIEDGTNWYDYGDNDPTDGTDPTGLVVYLNWSDAKSGQGHLGVVVYCPCSGKAIRYDGSGARGQGQGDNVPHPTRDDKYWDKVAKDRNNQIIDTGMSCEQEIQALEAAFAKMSQVRSYSIFGPNSNTFAHQLLLNAGFPDPKAPANAPGWNYDGAECYGGSLYDKNGKPRKESPYPPGPSGWGGYPGI